MFAHEFWQRYKYSIVGAGIGILLNLGILMLSIQTAEGGGMLIYLFANLPFCLLDQWLNYSLGICIWGGVLMYAVLGWFVGAWLEKKGVFRNN